MELQYNKGLVTRTINGYFGKLSIEGYVMDIVCTFWSDKKPDYIWVQRVNEKIFDIRTKTFSEYTPKPSFVCKADKTRGNDIMDYRGEFMFIGFKYELCAWFEDRTEHQLNFEIKRSSSQPILKRLNEINKQINTQKNHE